MDKNRILRNIPKVDDILEEEKVKVLLTSYPRGLIIDAIHEILEEYRTTVLSLG